MTQKNKPIPCIQIDTREQTPWNFNSAFKDGKISGTFTSAVEAGDYIIKGRPDLVVVERKKNVAELYNNFIPQSKKERFYREMQKMQSVKYKYIVVEQTWEELYDPSNFRFSRRNQYFAGSIVLSNLITIMSKFNVHIIFAGQNAEHTTIAILLKHYYEEEKYDDPNSPV